MSRRSTTHLTRGSGAWLSVAALAFTAPAFSQAPGGDLDEVVVTGYRAALASGLDTKRNASVMVDEIKAEDIADFPDSNLAEAIQRLPGISLDRADNGEGQKISVRGLGADFTSTTLNGMDVLATSGGGNSDGGPNRTRGFDFNIFASELFSSLKVQKSASASTDEGSLGATVALSTGRPLDYGKLTARVNAEARYFENGQKTSPRLAALIADTFMDNTLGVLFSAAYNKRDSVIDRYNRNVNQFEYTYRNSQLTGVTPPTYGFARPVSCTTQLIVGCGSDPTAYAKVDNFTIFPTLPTLSHRDQSYDRLGLTHTIQWKPDEKSELKLDALYGYYKNKEVAYELTPVGANRNGYNNVAANSGAPTGLTQFDFNTARTASLYPVCTRSATADCGQSIYGTTLVTGMSNSFNPFNLDPWDYYNVPSSVGYINTANRTGGWAELVGRTNMQLRDVNVVRGPDGQSYMDYMAVDNVDWRNSADGSDSKTKFSQVSLSYDQELSDSWKVRALLGTSRSVFDSTGKLIELNAVDKDGFVFDERDRGDMPIMSLGFDPTLASNWDTVKGLSTIRIFKYKTVNSFRTAKLDFTWDMNDQLALNTGAAYRRYTFEGYQGRRTTSIEAINPTTKEAGISVASLGKVVNFGEGLNVSAGTPTSWFAPTWEAFDAAFNFSCECINKWGDWRTPEVAGSTNKVIETDSTAYAELAFNYEPFGRKLFGNVGVRVAKTDVESAGRIPAAGGTTTLISVDNSYSDPLPSLNVAYEFVPDVYARFAFAKVMARPLLQNLAPNGTFPTTCTAAGVFCSAEPSITVGNPKLDPFRANNYDLSFEWYFSKEGLLQAAFFYKDILNNPQTVRTSATLAEGLDPDVYSSFAGSITNAALLSHINNNGTFSITQQRNAPGGYIRGFELSWQQPFTFLPGFWSNFGIQTNFTHLESSLSYIVNSTTGATRKAPYLNASPDAYNATLYYQEKHWQARVSAAYRKEYMQAFPVASGSCDPGLTTNGGGVCNAPVIADFRAVKDNLQIDASFRYDITNHVSVSVEAQNLFNEPLRKWVYQDVKFAQQYGSTGRIFAAGVSVKL